MQKNIKYFALILTAVLVCVAIISNKIESRLYNYVVSVTYLNGENETFVMMQHQEPSVSNKGCMYDYSKKTHICGIRKISFFRSLQEK